MAAERAPEAAGVLFADWGAKPWPWIAQARSAARPSSFRAIQSGAIPTGSCGPWMRGRHEDMPASRNLKTWFFCRIARSGQPSVTALGLRPIRRGSGGVSTSDSPTRCSISLRSRSRTAKPTLAPSSVGSTCTRKGRLPKGILTTSTMVSATAEASASGGTMAPKAVCTCSPKPTYGPPRSRRADAIVPLLRGAMMRRFHWRRRSDLERSLGPHGYSSPS
jgi:hypothetical protein